MKPTTIQIAVALLAPLIIAGCAASSRDPGFTDVQRVTVQRIGQQVQWNGHTSCDQAVQASIDVLLAKPLTVDSAVQIALLNNHDLQATFEDLGIAQADLVQAGLLKNPVFDLSIRVPTRPPSRTYVDLNVTEDFLSIFFIPARQRLAEAQLQQAKARVTGEVLNLAAQTKSAFYVYQADEQMVELHRTVQSATTASADTARLLHDAGNSTDLDLLNAEAQDARGRVELANAQADAAEARERLNELMGASDNQTAWTAAAGLPKLPAEAFDLPGLEDAAIHQRCDLAAAQQEARVQAQALGFTMQTRFFTDARIGAEGERETDGQWRIGPDLSIPVPLFDQGQAAVPRARAMLRQSRQRCLALAANVRSQVRAACNRMAAARVKAVLYRDQFLPLQQQVLDQTQLQYNGMLVGVFQLLQARREQVEVNQKYIEALRDYWTARADLERAVGGRLPAPAKPQGDHS